MRCNAEKIIISNIVQAKSKSKYLVAYLDKVTRPLVLTLPKMSGYVKTFKYIKYNGGWDYK